MSKRNPEFIRDCRELTAKGYTQTQIIEKLKSKYNFPTLSRHTIRRANQEGLPPSKGYTNNATIVKQSA